MAPARIPRGSPLREHPARRSAGGPAAIHSMTWRSTAAAAFLFPFVPGHRDGGKGERGNPWGGLGGLAGGG